MISKSKIAAVVVLGPGKEELDRLDDILGALRCYAPEISPVVVLNDGNNPSAIADALRRNQAQGFEFPNPRAGRGSFWLGRMTFGLACVYRLVSKKFPGHHILRLDSDALI